MILEIFLALGVGILVGIIFSACKLPLPSPPVFAGIVGIAGIFLGGEIWKHVQNTFFS